MSCSGQLFANSAQPTNTPNDKNTPSSADSSPALAQQKTPLPPTSDSTREYFLEGADNPVLNTSLKYIDSFQSWLGDHVDNVGERADTFFGSEQSFDRSKGSRLDVLFPMRYGKDGTLSTELKYRAKIELPRTNQRWHLIVESVDENLRSDSNGNSASPTVVASNGESEETTSVGLRFMIGVKDYTFSFVDVGLNFRNLVEPDPFARIRGEYKWELTDKFTSRMNQNLFWENFRGVGLNSRQTFDYAATQEDLLRSETDGTWWDKGQYYDLNHNFIMFHKINEHRGVSYNVGWNWNTLEKGFHLNSYNVGINVRERIYKKWLFFEIEPRVSFFEEDEFTTADPSITFTFEIQFYNRAKKQ